MKHSRVLLFFCCLACCRAAPGWGALTQSAPLLDLAKAFTPRAGEIAFEGRIAEVRRDSIVLLANSFELSNGRQHTFDAPREKTVAWTEATTLRGQGGEIFTPDQKRLRAGFSLRAVGRDEGSGSVLKARAMWLTDANRVLDGGAATSLVPPIVLPDEPIFDASQTAAQRIDYSRLTLKKTYANPKTQLHRAVVFSPDGNWLAVGGDGFLWILERKTGRTRLLPIHDLVYTPGKPAPVFDGSISRELFVRSLAFSHDSKSLFLRGSLNYVQKMSVRSGKIVETFDYENKREPQVLTAMALSPADRTLLMGGRDGQVKLLDLATHQMLRVLKTQHPFVASVAFSGDGSRIVTASLTPAPSKPTPVSTMRGNAVGAVEVWEVKSGKLLRSTPVSHLDICALRLSRDGSFLLGSYVDDGDYIESAQLWDVRSQALLNRFSTGHTAGIKGYVDDVALSNDNSVFAVLSDAKVYQPSDKPYVYPIGTLYKGRLQLWSRVPPAGDARLAAPVALLTSVDMQGMMTHLAWSPDARTLAVVFYDGTESGRSIEIYSVD